MKSPIFPVAKCNKGSLVAVDMLYIKLNKVYGKRGRRLFLSNRLSDNKVGCEI